MLRDYKAGRESRREKGVHFSQTKVPGTKRRLMITLPELKAKGFLIRQMSF
jgi:hypothetical protein